MQKVVQGPKGPITKIVSAKDLTNPDFVYQENPEPEQSQSNMSHSNEGFPKDAKIEEGVEIPKNCKQVQVMQKVVQGPNGPITTIVSARDLSKE